MGANYLRSRIGRLTAPSNVHDPSVWTVLALRLMIGVVFVQAGWQKLSASSPFTAEGYLTSVTAASPLSSVFLWLGNTPWALESVNVLVPWGELLIGLALLAGLVTRLAAAAGILMMALFYVGNWSIANGAVLTDELQYALILLTVAALGAGRVLGVDSVIETYSVSDQPLIDRYPRLGAILG